MTNEERAQYDRHWMSLRYEEEAIEEAEIGGLERGRKDGRAEGHAEGRAEGRAEALLATARSMKADGLPVATIAKYTGLAEAEIAEL